MEAPYHSFPLETVLHPSIMSSLHLISFIFFSNFSLMPSSRYDPEHFFKSLKYG